MMFLVDLGVDSMVSKILETLDLQELLVFLVIQLELVLVLQDIQKQ